MGKLSSFSFLFSRFFWLISRFTLLSTSGSIVAVLKVVLHDSTSPSNAFPTISQTRSMRLTCSPTSFLLNTPPSYNSIACAMCALITPPSSLYDPIVSGRRPIASSMRSCHSSITLSSDFRSLGTMDRSCSRIASRFSVPGSLGKSLSNSSRTIAKFSSCIRRWKSETSVGIPSLRKVRDEFCWPKRMHVYA